MATVPSPPAAPIVEATGTDEITVNWGGYGVSDGGSPVNGREIWGSSNLTPTYPHAFTGTDPYPWGGLTQGSTYYFWARTRNAVGWSNFGGRAQATTWDIPEGPARPYFADITQTSVLVGFDDKGTGGVPIVQRQIGYTLTRPPSAPDVILAYSGTGGDTETPVTDLDPGQIYWFSARVRNLVGWSPWGLAGQLTLVAGARVNQGGVWKRAVPYVKDAGVWKVARPWVKNAGVWKETSL